MTASRAKNDGMGSLLYPDGSCRFRVWAPFAKRVQVEGTFTQWETNAVDLFSEGNGNWAGEIKGVSALDLYKYMIENVGGPANDNSRIWERSDARALQVESSAPQAASYVVPPVDQTHRPGFQTPGFDSFILYQLHVGSFAGMNDLRAAPVKNRTATFLDIIDKLAYIKGLGFNALALLPIGNVHNDLFGGNAAPGEGYATSDMFAPEDAYGTTAASALADMLKLIDAAHSIGLAIIFDVVYSHSATADNRYWQYDGNCSGANGGGIYFKNGNDTQFGAGFSFWQKEVKDFFLDNARLFLGEYRVDGLRFDATQFIQPDAVEYIIGNLQHEFPDKYLIAEYNPGDPDSAAGPLDPYLALRFDAIWDLASPGQALSVLNGNDPVNNLISLIGNFENSEPWNRVRYLTGSHDQIFDDGTDGSKRFFVDHFGGRDNDWARAKARLAYALNVALPGTPMLFMGTEAHLDGFWNPDEVNNCGDRRIDWNRMGDPIGSPMQQMVRDINYLRRVHPALRAPAGYITHADHQGQVVAFKRYTLDGDVLLIVVNAGDCQWTSQNYGVGIDGDGDTWNEIFNSQAPAYGGIETTGNFGDYPQVHAGRLMINLPQWCVLIFKKD